MLQLIPTVKNEVAYKAKNAVTGLYWNGKGFCTPLFTRAKTLTNVELIVIKHTYENVTSEEFVL